MRPWRDLRHRIAPGIRLRGLRAKCPAGREHAAGARQRAQADDPLQAGGMGRGERGHAGGSGRPLAVRAVAAPRQDARGRHRRLPARLPDHLVSHRRSANRAAARHPAPAVLPPATQEQERSIDHDPTHHRPARGQASHRRRSHPGGYPGRRRACARAHPRRPPSRALEARRGGPRGRIRAAP